MQAACKGSSVASTDAIALLSQQYFFTSTKLAALGTEAEILIQVHSTLQSQNIMLVPKYASRPACTCLESCIGHTNVNVNESTGPPHSIHITNACTPPVHAAYTQHHIWHTRTHTALRCMSHIVFVLLYRCIKAAELISMKRTCLKLQWFANMCKHHASLVTKTIQVHRGIFLIGLRVRLG